MATAAALLAAAPESETADSTIPPPTVNDLKSGDSVEAIGLTEPGQKSLNGEVGVLIKRYSRKNGGRLEVRFTENGKPKIVGLDPQNACVPGGAESLAEKARKEKEIQDKAEREKTQRGKYVEVFGLTSEKGMLLNGQRGIVIKRIEASGRIEVCLGESGKEGNLTSLKPDCLKLVTDADATEVENAKEVAFPHLKAAMDEFKPQPIPAAPAAGDQFGGDFERDRSWSPPPETRQAASAAALQAASLASSRGYTPQQAEAYGAAAAENTLKYAKDLHRQQEALLKAQAAAAAQAPRGVAPGYAMPGMIPGMIPGMVHPAMMQPGMVHPGMVHPGMVHPQMAAAAAAAHAAQAAAHAAAARPPPPPPSTPRADPKTVAEAQIGDSLEACGLKGKDASLNNDKGTITNILGFAQRKRYVMKFTEFIIDDNGDLAEKQREATLTAENLRIPGSGPAEGEDAAGDGDDGADDDLASSSRSRSRKKKSRSRKKRRSRSRRKASFI